MPKAPKIAMENCHGTSGSQTKLPIAGASPDFSHNVGVIAGSHSLSCRFFNAQRFAVAH